MDQIYQTKLIEPCFFPISTNQHTQNKNTVTNLMTDSTYPNEPKQIYSNKIKNKPSDAGATHLLLATTHCL